MKINKADLFTFAVEARVVWGGVGGEVIELVGAWVDGMNDLQAGDIDIEPVYEVKLDDGRFVRVVESKLTAE